MEKKLKAYKQMFWVKWVNNALITPKEKHHDNYSGCLEKGKKLMQLHLDPDRPQQLPIVRIFK